MHKCLQISDSKFLPASTGPRLKALPAFSFRLSPPGRRSLLCQLAPADLERLTPLQSSVLLRPPLAVAVATRGGVRLQALDLGSRGSIYFGYYINLAARVLLIIEGPVSKLVTK